MLELPYSLMSELEKVSDKSHPPVHLWHPDNEKDIDMLVAKDGTWLYGGTPIRRPRLVRLFASVLRRENDDYFLVTPAEKCRIAVEDTPFQGVLMDVAGVGENQVLQITTDMGERVQIGAHHPLRIEQQGEEWIPYVFVRDGMEARLNRNVYYQLADLLMSSPDSDRLGIWSDGQFFGLMTVTDG